MNNISKGWARLMVLTLAIMLVLSACSQGNNEETPAAQDGNSNNENTSADKEGSTDQEAKPELEQVNLIWYYPNGSAQPDLASVQEAFNKITLEKINATVELKPIDFGEYDQKMNTSIAAGEKFDLVWTSNWSFFYGPNVTKGAFLPLDDLIGQYAPELKSTLPEFLLEGTKVDGKIYAVPNYQTLTNREGVYIQTSLVEKYGLDTASIKSLQDLQPFLEQVKAGEPDMIPLLISKGGTFSSGLQFGMEYVGAHVIGIDQKDPYKAIIIPQSQAYKDNLWMMREWYTKKLVNQDAPTIDNAEEIIKSGKVAVIQSNVMPVGDEINQKNRNGGHDVTPIYFTEPFVSSGTMITTMNAISRTSENPERAMMLINLLNTDKDLYNLISYGIEGKHYEFIGDNMVKVIEDGGYNPNGNWIYGNTFNGYLVEGQSAELMQAIIEENNTANPSALMGFTYSDENVKSEIANISAVGEQYNPGLQTGAADPEEKYEEYLSKLEKAGVQKVLEDAQRQIDEWRAANGK